MIFWFFGYPGIGKDFLAEKLSKLASIPHIDADDFLSKTDKKKLSNGSFTQRDRIRKLKRIIKQVKLLEKNPNIAAADSLPDNLSRKLLLDSFRENITFIYVTAPKKLHLKRLKSRKNHFFTENLLDNWINKHWETIEIPHTTFQNIEDLKKLEKKLLSIYFHIFKNFHLCSV